MIDLMVSDVAKFEYEERLSQLALERRILAQGEEAPGVVNGALLKLSGWLIDTGERLRHRVEMTPGLS